MNGGNVAVLAGVLIIVTGIALVGVQVLENHGDGMKESSFKLIKAQAGAMNFEIETGFPGIPIIALGILLLVIGAVTTRSS
jgi:hypothetical protein